MKKKTTSLIDEEFSVVGFGCWPLAGGDAWNGSDDRDSIEAAQRAVDLGVNLFDVAPAYGLGHAEEVLGEALVGRRHRVLIASKCGVVWDDRQRTTINLTAESLKREIDASLRRLNTDYVDIYQIHWPDPETPIEETMAALERIREAGKIRYVGVCNFSLDLLERAMAVTRVVSFQGLHNLLERNAASYHGIPLDYRTEDEILPFCRAHGLAFFPYSPLFQGLLTGTFEASDNFDENDVRASNPKLTGETFQIYFKVVEKLKALAQEIGRPLSQVAINWLINHEAVTSVICGAQSVRHVEENVGSVSWELTGGVERGIEEVLSPYREAWLG